MNLLISSRIFRAVFLAAFSVCFYASAAFPQSPAFLRGLVLLQQGDPDAAFKQWQPLVQSGDRDAQYGMALLYESGGQTFQADMAKAVRLYGLSAEQGLREAQTNLGLLYAEGRGVSQDPGKAASYWQSAAQDGHDMAQFNLGLAYYAGNGVPQNLSEAVGLIYAAAANGLPEAQFAFGQFHRLGLGINQSDTDALYWFAASAAAGNPDAVPLVKELTDKGISVPATYNTAVEPPLPLALEGSVAAATYGKPEVPVQAQSVTVNTSDKGSSGAGSSGAMEMPLDTLDMTKMEQDLDRVFDPTASESANGAGSVPAEANMMENLEGGPLADPQDPFAISIGPLDGQTQTDTVPTAPRVPEPRTQEPRIAEGGNPADIPVSELVMIEEGQSLGLLYAAWLGSEASVKGVEKRWQTVVRLQPDLFTQIQAGIEVDRIGQAKVFRLMAGPFPSKSVAWQICNAVKIANPTLFCKARKIR